MGADTDSDCGDIWFPTQLSDLDKTSNRILVGGIDLDCDHPGFNDPVYTKRRREFIDISSNYKQGEPIPYVEYTAEENKTWDKIYRELKKLYPKYACKEYLSNLPYFEQHCGYGDGKVPQLEIVSNYLLSKTGFSLRPVAGFLSSRDFLATLAFRVFCCTQYIRHPSDPFYTPEPDICHELLGHMPMFADQEFADFSQQIGLASLGATDEQIENLAKVYVFTVEFGMCRQEGEVKAYGAGLLSSISEFQYAMEASEKQKEFSISSVLDMTINITAFQDFYFVKDSFEKGKSELRSYSESIKGDLELEYDQVTRSISVKRNKRTQ